VHCCTVCSIAGHSLDELNEVFQSATFTPSFNYFHSELGLRRATVAGDLSAELQPCFSTGDLPSLVEQETTGKSRPKSFFPTRGDVLHWGQLHERYDSSDLSDDDLLSEDTHAPASKDDTVHGLLDVLFLNFYAVKCSVVVLDTVVFVLRPLETSASWSWSCSWSSMLIWSLS